MNKLNHLKNMMSRTVLRNGALSYEEKERIFLMATNQQKKVKRIGVAPLLSAATVFILLISFGIYGYNQLFENESIALSEKERMEQVNGDMNTADINTTSSHLPDYHYVVHDGYFYKITKETVKEELLAEKVAEVKRSGTNVFKKEGDSTYFRAGSLFTIEGKDKTLYIAGAELEIDGTIKPNAYRVFKRQEKVNQPKEEDIITAEGNLADAVEKIKTKIANFYAVAGLEKRAERWDITYTKGPFLKQMYRFPEGDQEKGVQGYIFIHQYKKGLKLGESRFNKTDGDGEGNAWVEPKLVESFSANGINWGVYKDKNADGKIYEKLFLKGDNGSYEFEIVFQGDASLEQMKQIAEYYKVSN